MSRINFLECARAVQKTSSIFTQSYEKKSRDSGAVFAEA